MESQPTPTPPPQPPILSPNVSGSSLTKYRIPTPPMTDDEAKTIHSTCEQGDVQGTIATTKLLIGKMTDSLRRFSLVVGIVVTAIGSSSGLTGAIMTHLRVEDQHTLLTVFFILAGISSAIAVGFPRLVDFIKQFSGRGFREEYPRWIKVSKKFGDEDSLGDAQGDVLSMFAFVSSEKDYNGTDIKRYQIKAIIHFLTQLQSAQKMSQFVEAYQIVMPVFRIASTISTIQTV